MLQVGGPAAITILLHPGHGTKSTVNLALENVTAVSAGSGFFTREESEEAKGECTNADPNNPSRITSGLS